MIFSTKLAKKGLIHTTFLTMSFAESRGPRSYYDVGIVVVVLPFYFFNREAAKIGLLGRAHGQDPNFC